jgi:hypothetical protein
MICELCKGKGFVQGQAPDIPTACSACGGKGFVNMTNEEWFCQLPTGEKAEFFANIYPKSVGEALIKISNGDKEKWELWLKQPHHE